MSICVGICLRRCCADGYCMQPTQTCLCADQGQILMLKGSLRFFFKQLEKRRLACIGHFSLFFITRIHFSYFITSFFSAAGRCESLQQGRRRFVNQRVTLCILGTNKKACLNHESSSLMTQSQHVMQHGGKSQNL